MITVMVEAGWYVDPQNPHRERQWDGTAFVGESRPVLHGRPFPGQLSPAVVKSEPALKTLGNLIYLIAAAVLVGAVVYGAHLITHKVCGLNPYDLSSTDCSAGGESYPWRGAGLAVLIGGVLQAVVILTVGRLCYVVADVRARLASAA